MKRLRLSFLVLIALVATPASGLEILHVRHVPIKGFDPDRGEAAKIHFQISEPAQVTAHIFDGRDLLIRTLPSTGLLPVGDHGLAWDGRDAWGRSVPPEAYRYVLEATNPDGRSVTWDLSDRTGGEDLKLDPPKWNAETQELRYELPRPARVRIRVGLKNGGPLMGTPLNWAPRSAGLHVEVWDGRDSSAVIAIGDHPNLLVDLRAFSLSNNTILVNPPPGAVDLISDLPESTVRRARADSRPKRMYDYANQPIESLRDFPLRILLPAGLKTDSAGLPIVGEPAPVLLELREADRALLINERFEAVFYLDGRYVFETEVGFFPMTWTLDPARANPGEHYLTVNLRGYEGHFGIATTKLLVRRPNE